MKGTTKRAVESAARTANGSANITGTYEVMRVQLDVTAVSGTTPSLTLIVEDTLDGVNYNAVDTFPAQTAVGRVVRNITTPFSDRLRLRWTITGTTPSFTFGVDVAGA